MLSPPFFLVFIAALTLLVRLFNFWNKSRVLVCAVWYFVHVVISA